MPQEAAMKRLVPVPALCIALLGFACDSGEPAPDPAEAKASNEAAERDAALEKRKQERLAKEAEEEAKAALIVKRIEEVTVIPEGTKLPKKIEEACDGVVAAQEAFMKKFHGDTPAEALTTQLGMLKKQCIEGGNIEIAMCQKFALEATDELLAPKINEYLPACMGKYAEKPPG